jgi:ribosomal protein L7Ae-like RNA K-turn-binding protein
MRRAGRIEIGSTAVRRLLVGKKARFVLVASDVSDKARERWLNSARSSGAVCVVAGTKETLGMLLGRRTVAVAATGDRGFADALASLMTKEE